MRTVLITLIIFSIVGCKKKKAQEPAPRKAAPPVAMSIKAMGPVTKAVPVVKSPKKPVAAAHKKGVMTMKEVQDGVAKFKPMTLSYPEADLSPELKPVLIKLIEAAFIMDELFLKQVYRKNGEVAQNISLAVKKDATLKPYQEYFRIMYGPWDRTAHNKPFWGTVVKPAGAGYYAEGITKASFNSHVSSLEAAIKAEKDPKKLALLKGELEGLKSYYTVIELKGNKLVSVPYHVYYKAEVTRASKLLKEAAALSKEPTLKRYLNKRAEALLTDDYRESDFAWLKIDGDLEVVIGPYEVYEDELNGYKAAYESFINLVDKKYSAKLKEVASFAGELDKNLPYDAKFRETAARNLPIKVVNELYTAGDTKAGVQTLAFNLPNDPVVRGDKKKGGYKLVLLKNVAEAKFQAILTPIAKRLITPAQLKYITFDAFFTHTLYHESAHGIGPSYVTVKGKKVKIREFMKEFGSANEEAKADMSALLSLEYMITKKKKGTEDQLKAGWVTFVASIFRSIRFGATEAHGKANLMALNWLLTNKAVTVDAKSGTFAVDFKIIGKVTRDFVKEILDVQTGGSYEKAAAFEKRWAAMPASVKAALSRLADIPVDINPSFKILSDLGLKDPR